jgi:GH43 family beta-xylosidase
MAGLQPARPNPAQRLLTVFARDDAAKVYGPDHDSFFRCPDGKKDLIAYHANIGTEDTFADRPARAQRFTWNADGTPNVGKPLPLEAEIKAPSGEARAGKSLCSTINQGRKRAGCLPG